MNRQLPFFREVGDSLAQIRTLLGDRRVLPRPVDVLGSSRRAQTAVAVVVSTFAALSVAHAFNVASDARSAWTGTERAYMLLDSVADGEEITPASVKEVLLPLALTPDGRVNDLRPGMRARIALPANVVLVTAMLDAAVNYPASWRVVALPSDVTTLPLSSGDRVDVVAGTSVLVSSAIVVSITPLTLAVPPDLSSTVAAAVRIGDVSLLGR